MLDIKTDKKIIVVVTKIDAQQKRTAYRRAEFSKRGSVFT